MRWIIGAGALTVLMAGVTERQSTPGGPPASPAAEGRSSLSLSPALGELYRRSRGKVPYLAPTEAEAAGLRTLGRAVLEAARSPSVPALEPLQKQAATLGLRLEILPLRLGEALVLREAPEQRRGWGAYLFRRGALASEFVLQAPHTFYDQGTGPLALALFDAFPCRALYFNTIHRGKGKEGDDGQQALPTDVAHNPAHPYQLLTAALSALPAPRVIQLHGFDAREGGGPEVILSTGDGKRLQGFAEDAAQRISKLPLRVARYPDETRLLGALTNVQGQLVRTWPEGQFLHVELEAATRRRLVESPAEALQFGAALLGVTSPTPTDATAR